tara:strand:+ start:1009 stop:1254 length:246 start_codon:yes stop_codon:yes gene_type:complete
MSKKKVITNEYITKTVSCNECEGTGFVEITKEELKKKKYCQRCEGIKRCYLCQNVKRLGKYDMCKKCFGQGYYEIRVKKSN